MWRHSCVIRHLHDGEKRGKKGILTAVFSIILPRTSEEFNIKWIKKEYVYIYFNIVGLRLLTGCFMAIEPIPHCQGSRAGSHAAAAAVGPVIHWGG